MCNIWARLIARNYVIFSHFLFPFFLFWLPQSGTKAWRFLQYFLSQNLHVKKKQIRPLISRGGYERKNSLDCSTQLRILRARVSCFVRKALRQTIENYLFVQREFVNTFQNSSRRCIANSNHTKTVPSGMSNEKSCKSQCVIVCQISRLLYSKDNEVLSIIVIYACVVMFVCPWFHLVNFNRNSYNKAHKDYKKSKTQLQLWLQTNLTAKYNEALNNSI